MTPPEPVERTALGGVLRVDKRPGPTSHDVVAAARRALGTRRIGHTGTLDPFASGLLLLCVGRTTRLAEYLSALPKRYGAVLRLGERTDTDDRTGTVVERCETWRERGEAEIRGALLGQVGRRQQTPPAFSAKKVAGERLYARARRGEPVAPAPVEVDVMRIVVRSIEPPRVGFDVLCSSGTYVRAIARDVGIALGTGAHLEELRRTAIGPITLDHAVASDALDDAQARAPAWLSPLDALRHLDRVDVGDDDAAAIAAGRAIAVPAVLAGSDDGLEAGSRAGGGAVTPAAAGETVVIAHAGGLIAVGERGDGRVRPRKVLVDA